MCVFFKGLLSYLDQQIPTLLIFLWNHYRRHWIAAYWQSRGITVIPTMRSSTDKRSLSFYLDGEPEGGVVAYSSMWASDQDPHMQQMMRIEWEKMNRILKPKQIVVYGEILPMMKNGVQLIQIPKFTDKR